MLTITEKEKSQLEVANPHYKKKGFEYYKRETQFAGLFRKELPQLDVIERLTEKIIAILPSW